MLIPHINVVDAF